MDIFFIDPEDTPLPPDEVRIRELSVRPYPDRRRVKVYLELTPFQKRPDAELQVIAGDGSLLARVNVIETIDPKLDMTLHIPPDPPEGPLSLLVVVFYRPADEGDGGREPQPETTEEPEILVVDRQEAIFNLPDP